MALRGIQPESVQKRLKALFYGCAGAGKTTASIQFPRPYLIDTEKGAENDEYLKLLKKSGGAIFQSSDFDEILKEVKSLLTEEHTYKTLVIDPFTIIYNDLLDKSAIKNGTEFGKHYGDANKQVKHLLSLLLRLDMNVIITAHSKNEYGDKMSVLGQTFDCYKKLDYLFDLVFEIQKRGRDRVAVVKKSRIKAFADLEAFPFTYDSVADKYGREILEKDAVKELLATADQVNELKRLIDLLKVTPEVTQKWLDKCSSETFEEMPQSCLDKCINLLKSKIQGE